MGMRSRFRATTGEKAGAAPLGPSRGFGLCEAKREGVSEACDEFWFELIFLEVLPRVRLGRDAFGHEVLVWVAWTRLRTVTRKISKTVCAITTHNVC